MWKVWEGRRGRFEIENGELDGMSVITKVSSFEDIDVDIENLVRWSLFNGGCCRGCRYEYTGDCQSGTPDVGHDAAPGNGGGGGMSRWHAQRGSHGNGQTHVMCRIILSGRAVSLRPRMHDV